MKRRGAMALQKEREALQERSAALTAAKEGDRLSAICLLEESKALKAEAAMLRHVDEAPSVGAGGEVLPASEGDEPSDSALARETLLHPTAVNIGASEERLRLLEKANVSELGVDAAETIQAENSLEKMLAHQMVLCHTAGFKAISQADQQENTVEKVRLLNASARLMKTFQDGLLALHKIRTGGKQTVVVQHVHVTDGGQAVVTGSMKGRGCPDGG